MVDRNWRSQFGSIHLLIGAAEYVLANQEFETIMTDIYCNHVLPEVLRHVLCKLKLSDGKSTFDG